MLNSPYKSTIISEPFLFYEVRLTARLLDSGLSKEEVAEKIAKENLYQLPTEKRCQKLIKACFKRLEVLNDDGLVHALATELADNAKQINLYAIAKQHRILWDFMVTVIGEKYQTLDSSFGKIDINSYFSRLQEQDDRVATWGDKTIAELSRIFRGILVDNGYLDTLNATKLNTVWINPVLEEGIRRNGDEIILPAFGVHVW